MTSGHRLMVVAFVAFGGPRASHCICCTPPVVRSSCWLADGASPVAAIQAAIGCSGAQMVVVDNIGAPWLLDVGLNLNSSNQVVYLEPEVVLQARRGAFTAEGSVLIRIDNVDNVTLRGYGATLEMWKVDYANPAKYNHSEWRHAITITSARNISIEGITAISSGGDGINIGGNQAYMDTCKGTGALCDSIEILVRDCNLTDNYRNAMSVTGVVNLLVENTILARTGGTCCMGGVDLEPEIDVRHIQNVTFRDCLFEHNQMTQVVMNLGGQQNHTSNVLFDGCVIRNSPAAGVWILGVGASAPLGVLELRNTTIVNTSDFGIRVDKKNATGAIVQLTDTVLSSVAEKGHWPLLIQSGGVLFSNLTIFDRHNRPWVEAGWRTSQPVLNVRGTATVWTQTGTCHDTFNTTRGDQAGVTVLCKKIVPGA